MNVKELVPKNKYDDSNIDKLYSLSDEEIQPIIYDLLEWLEDGNWPIAIKVLDVLLKRENLVFPYVAGILNGDNIMWKYWLINWLIPNFTLEHKEELRPFLASLTNIESDDEDLIFLKESAMECYNKCFNNSK